MKKAYVTTPIIILLIAAIITSMVLINAKPDTSGINPAQKLAEFSKPSVVRVLDYAFVDWTFSNYDDWEVVEYFKKMNNQSFIGGVGSGAIISSNGYIVTNAHVVELSKMSDQEIADIAFNDLCYNIAPLFNVSPDEARAYLLDYVSWDKVTKALKVVLPGGEVYDGEIKTYGAPIGEGKDVSVLKIEGKNLPTLLLGSSENVHLQDEIWVFGYPGAADSSVLSQDSALVVSITDGKVSATDKKSAQGAPVLQVSAASTHGNSGGPVINKDGNIIGLLTFRGDTVNGQEVQGFNFVVPVDTVKEFVAQSGATNTASIVDSLYIEGLNLYWGGYYKDALLKFEEVQRLFPAHSEIKRFISESQTKASQSKVLWSKYKNIFYAVDAGAVVIIIALLIITFKKKKAEAEASAQTQEQPVQPISYTPSPNDIFSISPNTEQIHADLIVEPKQEEVPKTGSITIDGVTDLNNDGKIDILDVMLAIKMQKEEETNKKE